jgi:dolichyl-phosphate-mannose-protein mannosyltransferase
LSEDSSYCAPRGDIRTSKTVRQDSYALITTKINCESLSLGKVIKYDSLCGFLFVGWSLHYLPFFLMSRQLFLHHYFPALYYAILLLCSVFDLVTYTLRPRIRLQIAALLAIIAVWSFVHFSPLAYGTPWTKSQCNSSKWLKTWDFSWFVLCFY